MRRKVLGLVVCLSLLIGLVPLVEAAWADSGTTSPTGERASDGGKTGPHPDAARFEDLAQRWRKLMRELDVPGMAVAAVQNDRVVLLDAFGYRDPRTKAPVTPDTVFFIGDSTRPLVALATQQLADEGRIDVDSPVKKYLPRFELANAEVSATLTVRDLLCRRWDINSVPINWASAYTGILDDELLYRLLRKVRPREKLTRGTASYVVLGRVIEAVGGTSWCDYVTKHVLAPAGMSNTFCKASAMYASKDVALPMEAVGEQAWRVLDLRKSDNTMHAGGGIGSSATDLAKWLRINLNGGEIDGRRILSEKRMKEMQTQQVEAPARIFQYMREGYGMGWHISNYRGQRLVHQLGIFPGYRSNISLMPDRGVGVVVLVNASGAVMHFADLVACDVLDRLLGLKSEDLLPRLRDRVSHERQRRASERPEGRNPADGGLSLDPQAYVGTYSSDDWGDLTVAYNDGRLTMRLADLSIRIFSTGPDWFSALVAEKPFEGRFATTADKRVSGVTLERGRLQMAFTR